MNAKAILLVASREVSQRIRSRAYVGSTIVLMLGVAAIIVATAIVRDDDRRSLDVGVVDPPVELERALVSGGDALDTDVEVVPFDDAATAEQAVRDDEVDVAITTSEIVWDQHADDVDRAILQGAIQSSVIAARSAELGIDEQSLAELLRPVAIEDRFLEPEDGDRAVRIATASIGVVLLFLAIQSYGNMVLMGVVEEKSSRVVEVLLNHVRPRHLLAGKVLGIGALGLLQLVLVVISALVSLGATRGVDVPDVPIDALLWFVAWFLLGFALYATAFAMAGSLVSRQEDAASVVTPISIPFIGSYIASFAIAGSPDTSFATALSIFPLTAPMTMPVRIAAGHPGAGVIALSVGLTAASVYGLVVLAGRVYSRNVLRTGARVSWRAAIGAARVAEG